MRFILDPELSPEEQVVQAGQELGMPANEAVREGRIMGNKIKAIVILDGYLRYLQTLGTAHTIVCDASLIRQKLKGTNLALPVLRCSPQLALLACDRRNYLEYTQKCKVKTDTGLEDVLGMTAEALIEIRNLAN